METKTALNINHHPHIFYPTAEEAEAAFAAFRTSTPEAAWAVVPNITREVNGEEVNLFAVVRTDQLLKRSWR